MMQVHGHVERRDESNLGAGAALCHIPAQAHLGGTAARVAVRLG